MRKNIIKTLFCILMAVVALTSCKKDPIGETAVVSMSGEWYVTCDWVAEDGTVLYEDPNGMGKFIVTTFNTTENIPTEMYLSDCNNFWEFQIPVKVDQNAMTFASEDFVDNLVYECQVKVFDGKISLGTGLTPSGKPADEFECKVVFSDDAPDMIYLFKGIRYTGLEADE